MSYDKIDDIEEAEETPLEEETEDDKKSSKALCICMIVMIGLLVLALIDSFTTHYFKTMCTILADWTMENAPWSFIVFEFIIFCFLICCLPYGPLGVLSGALFYAKYGNNGIWIAALALFFTTTLGGCVCFALARYKFKESVKKQIDKSPKVTLHTVRTTRIHIGLSKSDP
jgi:uncharacterized membrane protein YdjX (TVP38/TMEM64 family)